ncbi:ankyrin repeat domain-containing protein 40-like [Candoia aspera]|uniref:ankyrin repeat domain-containing protein 40-like n=1 Tax=Candoia aspera TaxID=51853 RepID=UPI002FD86E0D
MSSHLEERLREAAALGDLEEAQALLRQGVAVNAQNEINGWTCLHWACKRNHTQIVAYLLNCGADKGIFTTKRELAAHLTSKKEIKKLLGVEDDDNKESSDLKLPVRTNYLTRASFPCTCNQERDDVLHTSAPPKETNAAIPHLSAGEPSPSLSTIQAENLCIPTSLHKEAELLGKPLWDGDLISPIVAEGSEDIKSRGQSCRPAYYSSTHCNRDHLPSSLSRQHTPNQTNGATMGTGPSLQPLLLTGTFPYNIQELVLKVRIQNPKENDFIEIELDRKKLTYQDLLRVCCCELGINSEQVEKIRKLPDTLLRKDKDVARLQNFQELELVLVRSITSPFRNAAATTLKERSCYNTKAAKLTY